MGFERKPNGDVEYSWVTTDWNGKNILPKFRNQGHRPACVMHAACAGTEMDILRQLASREPPTTTDLRFKVESLIADYEKKIGCTLEQDNLERLRQRGATWREQELLDLFQQEGAAARSAYWNGDKKVKLKGYEVLDFPDFDKLGREIVKGKPILGSMPAGVELYDLRPDEVYNFNPHKDVERPVQAVHVVLFVGFGFRGSAAGRPYLLVFMNSGGTDFGENGFGRVYFSSVYKDRFYTVSGDASQLPQDPADKPSEGSSRNRQDPDKSSSCAKSTTATTEASPPQSSSRRRRQRQDVVDQPRQRQRRRLSDK